MTSLGARAVALCDALAAHTDEPGRITRLYLSPAHRRAAAAVRDLMAAAGIDAVGNVVGRRQGAAPSGAPALLLGSHIDSVVDAGRFDGVLGVAGALAAVEELVRREVRLPFALEVIAFGDEESVRFPTSFSTSNALAGRYRPEWLAGSDAGGRTLAEALGDFGGDPTGIAALARRPRDCLGYLELHIEQGPVLEAAGRPVGVVSAIAGITRARCRVTGEAGHAGTVPMPLRRDALAAAAEMVAAVERVGLEAAAGTVATVGVLETRPGAVNVIPGEVAFTLDVRAPADPARHAAMAGIEAACRAIAGRRGVAFACEPFMDLAATPMDPGLMRALASACASLGREAPVLPSGAGHDAAAMAPLCPAGMLFVRCRGGISHNPAESVTAEDVDVAVRVLVETVIALAR